MQTQIARLMPVSEKTLCLSFEIRMPGASGLLNLTFPAVVSNAILHRLVGDWTRQRRHAPETRQRILDRAARAKVGAALQLPPTRIAAREIEALRPGSILRLKLSANQPAELRVAGVPLFAASPVSSSNHRGAHLAAPL
jgi:flagellar motor switch protein FliM